MPSSSRPFQLALAAGLLLGCEQRLTQPSVPDAAVPPASPAVSIDAAISPTFDPKDFVRGVNNPLFPLRPGTRTVFTGSSDGESERTIVDVTRNKKTILGIEAIVVLDRVFQHGELKEKTFDWYAQDEDGNVWYLGEDTKEYENGQVVSTEGSWEAGKHGARAGVIMLAHPRLGQSYQQEFSRGVAEDKARIYAVDVRVSVPYGKFNHCLETEEWTPLEPGLKERKFYCSGIGFVQGLDIPRGTGHTELVRIVRR